MGIALPEGFRYAVEIRNEEYLTPQYLDVLASHNVAHALNAWTMGLRGNSDIHDFGRRVAA
jgi:hypothetical protein